jgi:predicted nucleic acid-binding protein
VVLIVLDASVLIALLDPENALHEVATAAVDEHAADDLRISASAYSESLARSAIAALLVDVVPITDRIAAVSVL